MGTTRHLALATLLSIAAAQQSVLTLPFYGYDDQTIQASVIGADSTATTLSLACPAASAASNDEGGDDTDCGLAPSQSLTVGPSIYRMIATVPDEATATQDCTTSGTTGAVCVETLIGGNDPGTSTQTYTAEDVALLGVTITAGADKLGATGTPSSTSAGLTTIDGTNTPVPTTGSKSMSTTGSTPAETSTGAAVQGRDAVGVVAGLAGIMVLAM